MKKLLVLFAFFTIIDLSSQTLYKEYLDPTPGYSNAVSVSFGGTKTIHVAGQVGSGTSMEDHFRTSFQKVLVQLKNAGASFDDVVKLTIYIVDYRSNHLNVLSEARKEIFGEGPMPAVTMVGVEALAQSDMRVETEAVAIVEIDQFVLTPSELKRAQVFHSVESARDKEDSVFVLDFSGNALPILPDEMFGFSNLQSLKLDNTGVKAIPEEMGRFRKLQKLSIDHLQAPNEELTRLPSSITSLTALEEVNLNGNPNLDLDSAFDQLAQLPNLKILAIMNNRIVQLPSNLNKLESLEQVWLGQNQDLDIPKTLDDLAQLPNLKHLGFGGVGIEALTVKPGQFKQLENVWLAGNRLKKLKGIEGLPNLKSLTLNNNDLKEVPKELFLCQNLEFLGLDNNPEIDFDSLADKLAGLSKLKVLSLNNNELKTAPKNLANIESLQYLVIRGNAIPEGEIKQLQEVSPALRIIQ